MVRLSPELDQIIRQNIQDESTYQAIREMVARDRSSVDGQAHYLKRLHQLATSRYDSLDAMFLAYLRVGCDVLGTEHGVIRQIENDTVYTQAIFPQTPFQSGGLPLNQLMCQYVVDQHQTIAIQNISDMESLPQSIQDTQIACYIGTPLIVNNTLWGTICFNSSQAGASNFTETAIELIELMAQNVSHAISHYNAQQTTENRYRFIFENIDTPILMYDVDSYAIIDINSAATAFYGYSRVEFLALSMVDINMLPPSDIEAQIMESRAVGRPFTQFPHRLKADEVREVEDYTNDLLIDNRRIRLSIIYDYSDRHEAEEALKHSEANLRAIFDNASQFMFLVDDTANIVAMNRAASHLNELIHDKPFEAGETIHHYHIKADRYLVSDYINRALQGQSISHESFLTLHNNQPLYINYRYVPVKTPDDEIIGVCVTGQDITSLKLSQENLSRERNILRTLIDNLPDSIYIKDVDARLLTVNRRYLDNLGADSVEELLGKSDRDLYPEYGEQYYQDDRMVLDEDQVVINKDEPIILPDGAKNYFHTTKVPLHDKQGEVIGLVGIGRDITEQRETENALRRRDEILSTINDAAQQFLKDANWRDRIEEILGRLGESLEIERVYLKRNIEAKTSLGAIFDYEWSAEGIPEHRTYPKSPVLSRWVKILQRGELLYGHIDDMLIDEQQMMLARDVRSVVMAPIMVSSHWWGIIGFDAIHSDRHWHPVELEALATVASTLGAAIQREQIEQGLRDNEEKFHQLVTHIPEAFWIYDATTQELIYVTDNYESIFGITVEDRQKDINLFLEQVHPDDRHLVIESLHKQSQGEASHYEARFLDGEDGIRWVSVRIYPVWSEDSQVYRVAGIASDITEQKQAETDRIEMLAQQERISILSSFFRDASHEFKTPLSIINTSIYILGKSDNLQTRQEHYALVREQVRGMSDLVETLVLMSRLDSRAELTFAPLNVNSIMRQMDFIVHDLYKERADDFHVSLDETLPLILGHNNYIAQALKNLVDNAVRYSSHGDSIYLRTYRNDDAVIIEVEDCGIGISDSILPEIFKRFYRGDEAHSTRGFGLGLPIAQRIAQRHGGDIIVETEFQQGSRFKMLFPIIKVLNE